MTAAEKMQGLQIAPFSELFDKAVSKALVSGSALPTVRKLLAEEAAAKRAVGLVKYGEKSFQHSFENLMMCPVEQHLAEELIDAANYVATLIVRSKFLSDDKAALGYEAVLDGIVMAYYELRATTKEVAVNEEK